MPLSSFSSWPCLSDFAQPAIFKSTRTRPHQLPDPAHPSLAFHSRRGKRRSVAFLEACADPERGLPLTTLCLVGFPKYSTPELPGAVAQITSLKDLRFLKCDFRACDDSWWALAQAVPKLTSLERLAVGKSCSRCLCELFRLEWKP